MKIRNHLYVCAAENCSAMIASHLLMCVPHWAVLPDNIKTAVYVGHIHMQEGRSAKDWLIARERARLFLAVRMLLPEDVQTDIEIEIERLEAVRV